MNLDQRRNEKLKSLNCPELYSSQSLTTVSKVIQNCLADKNNYRHICFDNNGRKNNKNSLLNTKRKRCQKVSILPNQGKLWNQRAVIILICDQRNYFCVQCGGYRNDYASK